MIDIFNAQSKKWNEILSQIGLKNRDIYHTPEYYIMHEINGDGKAQCFVYKEKDNIVLYPFLIKKIKGYDLDDDYYDIETAYGYGGPITNSDETSFLLKFEHYFIDYCYENNIIAEFIRFNPLIDNKNIFKTDIEILPNRKIVTLDLSKSIDRIWSQEINSKNRNMIRKAIRNDLKPVQSKDINTFKKIYFITMNKVKANGYYYFSEDYFDQIVKKENYTILNIKHQDEVIASSIFMGYGHYFHYHLSGSKKEYLNLSPNNFMLWEAIKLGKEKGYKFMNFGGGLSNQSKDSLFRFKSAFSRKHLDFYIGKRIHNSKVYSFLISEWEKKHNKKASILLQYRYNL